MKKVCRLFAILIVMIIGITTNVSAVIEECAHNRRTFNDKKLVSGVGNYGANSRYYWVDTNFHTNMKNRISYAVDFWVNTSSNPGVTTPISIVKTTDRTAATFEIRRKSLCGGTTGLTEFYSYSTKVADPSAKNQTWNICYIDGVKVTDLDYSNAQKTGLVAHELGHAMGLSHQPTRKSDSIMYNYDSRCFADGSARNRPAKRDCNNINHIY